MGGEFSSGNQCFGVVACQWRDSGASQCHEAEDVMRMRLLKNSCSCLCLLMGLIFVI